MEYSPCVALRFALPLAAVMAALGVGCLAKSNDIVLLRPQLPALPASCPVSVLADSQAPFTVEDLADITYTYTPGGRDMAMDALRSRTCYYGGDTIYRIREAPRGNTATLLTVRIARRTHAATDSIASATPRVPAGSPAASTAALPSAAPAVDGYIPPTPQPTNAPAPAASAAAPAASR